MTIVTLCKVVLVNSLEWIKNTDPPSLSVDNKPNWTAKGKLEGECFHKFCKCYCCINFNYFINYSLLLYSLLKAQCQIWLFFFSILFWIYYNVAYILQPTVALKNSVIRFAVSQITMSLSLSLYIYIPCDLSAMLWFMPESKLFLILLILLSS